MSRKLPKKPALRWYAVKSLFRTRAVGKPAETDSSYDSGMTMVEERVVLFRARNSAEAIRAAEKEASVYAKSSRIDANPYGQKVVTRLLPALECFELFDRPGPGAEVFSTTEVLAARVLDAAIIKQRLGHDETKREYNRRRNIMDREFAGGVRRGG